MLQTILLVFLSAVAAASSLEPESLAAAPAAEHEVSLLQTDFRLAKSRAAAGVKVARVLPSADVSYSEDAPDAQSEEFSLLQTDVQVLGTSARQPSRGAPCDDTGQDCDGEDDPGMSLLQLGLRLTSDSQRSSNATSADVDESAALAGLQKGHKTHASTAARALAWLARHGVNLVGRDASVAVWMILLGVVALLLVLFLAAGSPTGTPSQAGDKQEQMNLPQSPGASLLSRTPSRSPGPGSQLPSQLTVDQQRSPPASSASLLARGTSQQAMQRPPPTAQGAAELLPPICPSLVLPHTEARFAIQMDELQQLTSGSVNILGSSGRKLLHALVCDSPDGRRCLMIASCGCEGDPRTCIFTPQRQFAQGSVTGSAGAQSEAMEVFGKQGKFYGYLQSPSANQAVLCWSDGGDRPVMQLDMGDRSDFRMTASTTGGFVLANAGRNVGGGKRFEGGDLWQLQVKPGVDAVLLASCMLALVLLRPREEGRPSVAATPVATAGSLRPLPAARMS